MGKNILRYIVIGIFLLFFFHFETLYIGPIKISHLWKGIILIYLLISVITKRVNFLIYWPFIWIAILQILNIELIHNPQNAIVNFSSTLLLPVLGIYVLRFDENRLKRGLIFFSSFFIFAFIPYQLGLLTSIKEGYNLSAFGGTSGLIGPFQNPHGASVTLASALIVVLFYWFEGTCNRIYLFFLFLLGFYFLISTYVRTGLAMFAIGSLPILFYFGKKKASTFIRLIIFGFFLIIIASNWILNNDVLMNRITGQSKFRTDDSIETMGSGRGGIYIASIQIFIESNPVEKIFGIGQSEQVIRLYKKTNMRIGSHNGFLDLLLQNGVLGILLFLIYLFKIKKYSQRNKIEISILLLSLLISYITMTFFQGYGWLNANLLLMLAIAQKMRILSSNNSNAPN